MSQRDETALGADLAHEAGVDLFVHPRAVDRGGCQQDDEVRAFAQALIDLAPDTFTSTDLPLGPPGVHAVRLQTLRDFARQLAVLPPIAQESTRGALINCCDERHALQLLW